MGEEILPVRSLGSDGASTMGALGVSAATPCPALRGLPLRGKRGSARHRMANKAQTGWRGPEAITRHWEGSDAGAGVGVEVTLWPMGNLEF